MELIFINQSVDGQDGGFNGYGGIEDTTKYINAKYGFGWIESKASSIIGIASFTQAEFERNSNNCTLASITRIMKYYSDKGYTDIPSDIKEIYTKVREIGVGHGYEPKKTGLLRDLFVYTPWDIDNIVQDVWKAFGYEKGGGYNSYLCKLRTIRSDIDNSHPTLLNITHGDYKGHTVSVIGYKVFSKYGKKDIHFVQIFDGWSKTVRYIDWKKLGITPASVTRFLPPLLIP